MFANGNLNPGLLPALLGIRPGVTAIIGSGGKTTLMEFLADRLPGTVLLCTTTHIRRPSRFPTLLDPTEAEIREALETHRAVCAGQLAVRAAKSELQERETAARAGTQKTDSAKGPAGGTEAGKLAAPSLPFPVLASLADYVLAEADGARGLPLKAHAPWEPVIPENASRVVLVLGLDGIGRPIREVCHRPERYAVLAGGRYAALAGGAAGMPYGTADTLSGAAAVSLDSPVTPETAARVIAAEGFGDIVFLNQAESETAARHGVELADCLAEIRPVPVVRGSLRSGTFCRPR